MTGLRRRELIARAQRVATELSRFQAPRTKDPVNRSQVAEVWRYLAAHPAGEDLPTMLQLLPRSYQAKVARGAGEQLGEVRRVVEKLHREVPTTPELRYVLGWVMRLL